MRPQAAALLLLVAGFGCKDEPPPATGPEPMRAPAKPVAAIPAPPPPSVMAGTETDGETGEPERPAVVLPERPRADPDIERALDLIGASGLRFVDPPSEPDGRAGEYTAEQFAGMLRTKWDWIGYDLTELEPWLDAIATRSFKTNLDYQVVLADGTVTSLRPWLDAQLGLDAAPNQDGDDDR